MSIPKKSLLLLSAVLLAACAGNGTDWGFSPYHSSGVVPSADHAKQVGEIVYAEPVQDSAQANSVAVVQDPVIHANDAIEVRNQKRRILSKNFLDLGHSFFERGDYQGAALHYADAFQLNPESVEARDGIRRAQAAMGGEAWTYLSSEAVVEQQQLAWARQRLQVEGMMNDGDRAMSSGDFDTAIGYYRTAGTTLRYSPNIASDSLDAKLVAAKLHSATQARNQAEQALQASEAAAANAEANAEKEARAAYFENRLRTLLEEADDQFSMGFYGKSITTLDRVLDLSPRNADAVQLRSIANEAWHQQRTRNTTDAFREHWKRTFEELRTLSLPPKSTIEHDVDYWNTVVSKRQPLDEVATETMEDPESAQIFHALANTRIEPRFDNPIEEIVNNLAAYTRVSFVVSRAVSEDMDEDVKHINMAFNKPMPVSQILTIIEDMTGGEMKFKVENGVVNVITAEEANTGHVLRQYEVRSIIRSLPNFQMEEIGLSPSGGLEYEEIPLNEDREASVVTEDTLLTILGADDFEEPAMARVEEGTLIVYHRPDVHERINLVLADLRRSTNTSIEIKVRFLKVEDSFLQDVGIDFRGLGDHATKGIGGLGSNVVFDDFGSDPGSPGAPGTIGQDNRAGVFYSEADNNFNIIGRTENLYDLGLGGGRQISRSLGSEAGAPVFMDESDARDKLTNSGGLSLQWVLLDDTEVEMILRAVEKSKRNEKVTEKKLVVYNATRATLSVVNQVSYVADFDPEIAQAASIARPIVRVAMDGVFLDVLPVVTADRRSCAIDLRPTVATLRRPIKTFQTSLGSGSPVNIMLPELELQKVRTRATVPDGGTLLVGGFKVIEHQDMESGIPFLNKVPVLSFFFNRKGTYESYSRLVILLTAKIIIPEEFAPTPTVGALSH